jgi:hypothetical protein
MIIIFYGREAGRPEGQETERPVKTESLYFQAAQRPSLIAFQPPESL